MTLTGIYAVSLIGFIILFGYGRLISLCQGAFMAMGGYISGVLTVKYGLPPVAGLVAGIAASGGLAFIIGKITLRLHHFYLAASTMALAIIVESVINGWAEMTGGPSGLRPIPPIPIGGGVLKDFVPQYFFVWGVVLVLFVFALHIANSRVGRALKTLGHDETVAGTVGIDVAKYKVQAFVLAGAYGAISGWLYAHIVGFVAPSLYGVGISFEIMIVAILGGTGTLWGIFLAAPLLKFLPEAIAAAGDYKIIIWGLLFIFVPLYFRGGIAGVIERAWRKVAIWRTARTPSRAITKT